MGILCSKQCTSPHKKYCSVLGWSVLDIEALFNIVEIQAEARCLLVKEDTEEMD